MIGNKTTHRTVDGVRVPGTWRHAFIRNGGTHFLTDLFIYADGLIDCWELVTLEEFQNKLRSGRVATTLPDGAKASAFELASWTFSEPHSYLTPDLLVAEIRDTIDQLNGRPDSTGTAAVEHASPDRRLAALDAALRPWAAEARLEIDTAEAAAGYESVRRDVRGILDGDRDLVRRMLTRARDRAKKMLRAAEAAPSP